MGHLGVVLYEYLGEEYPEVLGSILGALKAIVNVIGMSLCKCFSDVQGAQSMCLIWQWAAGCWLMRIPKYKWC